MHNPFAPLIAIARRGIFFTASHRPLPRLPRYPQSLGSRGQPQRPMPTLADSRIQLKLRRLQKGARTIVPPDPPCDASYKKSPQDASQNLRPHPQPIEKIGACNVMIDNSTYPAQMRHTGGALRRSGEAGPWPLAPGPRPPAPHRPSPATPARLTGLFARC